MADEPFALFAPGALGTCWHGRYHYFEPWVGCDHDCLYCYARFRRVVQDVVGGGEFAAARPFLPPEDLLTAVRSRLTAGDIRILKLSRYTDFFLPRFLADGLAARVLQALLASPVERIIVTTKGVPDRACLDLMAASPRKVSYNVVAKPEGRLRLEGPAVPPVADRLRAAAWLQERGLQVTVHLDPLLVGVEDGEADLRRFLGDLTAAGLRRVMFSYLLVNPPMIAAFRARLGDAETDRLLEVFDIGADRQYLPAEAETVYFSVKPSLRRASTERVASLLRDGGFSFVLCSLKNRGPEAAVDRQVCPLCDGTFYA